MKEGVTAGGASFFKGKLERPKRKNERIQESTKEKLDTREQFLGIREIKNDYKPIKK